MLRQAVNGILTVVLEDGVKNPAAGGIGILLPAITMLIVNGKQINMEAGARKGAAGD
jgi:hypothetical protein